MEAGHPTQGLAQPLLARAYGNPKTERREIYKGSTFEGKTVRPLLQAADLLAWQTTKFVKGFMKGTWKPRRDFLELMRERHAIAYCENDFPASRPPYLDKVPASPSRQRDRVVRQMFGIPDATGAFEIRIGPITIGGNRRPSGPKSG